MEPERNIEKILRAAAKKRGEQAGEPLELHPVARQELLQEAARRSARKSGGGFFEQIFSRFGPRLALALSAVVVVVVLAIWLTGRSPMEEKTATLAAANYKAKNPAPTTEQKSVPASMDNSTLGLAANTPVDQPAPQNEIGAVVPLSEAAPAVTAAEPARTQAETAAPAAGARRDSGELAFKDEAQRHALPSAVLKSAPSNEAGASRKVTVNVEAPRPAGAAQSGVAFNDLSKAKAAPPPTPPAATYKNGWAVDSLAAGNTANKTATGPAAPSMATNATPITLAANDREARKQLSLQSISAIANTGQVGSFDNAVNNTAGGAPVAQRFYRVVAVPTVRQRGFGGGSAAAPLLASFQMEQNGQEIRVVDADGSVYTGSWQVAPEQNATPAARSGGFSVSRVTPAASNVRPAAAPSAENNFQAMQNYFFSVSGTNVNLKQRITFSGNFIPLSNLNTANNTAAVGATFDGRNSAQLNVTPPVMLNSRIAGKAVIGGTREIEVNANPLP
jgi:hypothetical protein